LYIGVFSPAIVAVGLTARSQGRAGVRELFQGILKARVSARWYAFALFFTLSIKMFNVLLLRAFTGSWPRFGNVPLFLIPFAIMISTPVQSGEELGWRGYALPRLAERLGLAKSSILLGVIWALWHLPLFYVADSDTYHQSFLVYTLQVTAISVAMAWLWERTGRSLLLVMLMHAAVNNTQDIVPAAVPGGASTLGLTATPLAWLGVVVLWIFALYFLAWRRRIPHRRE
jgi:membrane protease YdiL (CAAX protease family)